MEIRTIVTDLDDTLLDDNGRISDYAVSVLDACRARGVRVYAASGRAIHSMSPFLARIHNDRPFIACNGAQLAAPDLTPIETLELDRELALEMWDYIRAQGVYIQLYQGEGFYFEEKCTQSKYYERASGIRGEAVGDMHAFLTGGTPKLLCCDEPEVIERLYRKTLALYGDRLSVTISKPIFLELAPLGATKGAALKRLCQREGFSLDSAMAFGDSLNDLSMLNAVGYSVAMGNARDEVKAACRAVASPNSQDGVARFIAEHVLGEGYDQGRGVHQSAWFRGAFAHDQGGVRYRFARSE